MLHIENTLGIRLNEAQESRIMTIAQYAQYNNMTKSCMIWDQIAEWYSTVELNSKMAHNYMRDLAVAAGVAGNQSRASQNWRKWMERRGTPYTHVHVQVRASRDNRVEDTRLPYTFGVEIEMQTYIKRNGQWYDLGPDIVRTLNEVNIPCQSEHYNHDDHHDGTWKLVTDASVQRGDGNNRGWELVSPVLKGEQGMRTLELVCTVLDGLGVKTNSSCGLHVHLGAKNFTTEQMRNLLTTWTYSEDAWKKTTWYSRFGCDWARTMRYDFDRMRAISTDQTLAEYMNKVSCVYGTRYTAVNTCAYARHKTIEFRQHQGTIDFQKISKWVYMVQSLSAWCKDNSLDHAISEISDMAWASEDLRAYYSVRDTFNKAR